MKYELKKVCVIYSIFGLFFAMVYSFKNAKWVNEKFAMFFKRGDTSSPVYLLLIYSTLGILIIMAILKMCKNRKQFLYGVSLLMIVFFYFIRSLLEDGVFIAITSPTSPIVYLLSLVIFIGMDEDLWKIIKNCLPVLIFALVFLFLYEYLVLVAQHGNVVVGNSSLITYYVSLFWCSVIYLVDRDLRNINIGLWQIVLIGINIIFAVIINSRSWIIQSCFVALIVYLFGSSKLSLKKKSIRILFLIIIGFIIFQILNIFFSDSMNFLYFKMGQDSRSSQYFDIFRFSTLFGWIFGNGALAVYYDSLQGYTSSIDNQYLFISFHYGIILMIMWMIPQINIFCCGLKKHSTKFISLLPIFCWFMALGGLSIFNGVYCDLKQVLIMLYIGHVFYLNHQGGLIK